MLIRMKPEILKCNKTGEERFCEINRSPKCSWVASRYAMPLKVSEFCMAGGNFVGANSWQDCPTGPPSGVQNVR